MTDLDFKLNRKFYDNISAIKKRSSEYKSRILRSKNYLKNASQLSKKDITEKLRALKERPSPKEAVFLLRNLLNSGVWIGRSTVKYIHSVVDFTNKGDLEELTPKEMSILKRVQQGNSIEEYSDEEIFKTIYDEMEYSHYFPDHKPLLTVPSIEATMVLIPGVFNELFSTAAFERAAQHLQDRIGVKYFTPKVNGFKACSHNAELLKEQIDEYAKKHPNEKLWLICFSKGGLDTLHYLRANAEFANDKILGVSTIASPIMGSDHLNHKLIKFLNNVHNFSDTKMYKLLDNRSDDILAREFQKSISSTYQRPWLRKNHDHLPKDLFYTAIGFESEWYESHLWMVLTKIIFKSTMKNDGVVDAENSLFPYYFENGINLGIMRGHHLVGTRSSFFCQEALLESLIIFLKYRGLVA
jgi:hypothetical protein